LEEAPEQQQHNALSARSPIYIQIRRYAGVCLLQEQENEALFPVLSAHK
jgi:hypothetical protein